MGDDKFLKLWDLQSKTLAELFSFAEENGVEDASTMRKEQLMFAITQMFAETPIFEGKVERVTTIQDALAGVTILEVEVLQRSLELSR